MTTVTTIPRPTPRLTTDEKAAAEARFRRWQAEQTASIRRLPLYEQLFLHASDVLGGWR